MQNTSKFQCFEMNDLSAVAYTSPCKLLFYCPRRASTLHFPLSENIEYLYDNYSLLMLIMLLMGAQRLKVFEAASRQRRLRLLIMPTASISCSFITEIGS